MSATGPLVDEAEDKRFVQPFEGGEVFCDYASRGEVRALLHVEADPNLRGSGAAGQFMAALVEHGRAHGLTFTPVCGYAVAWFRRHPDAADVLT
ncbi:MAG: GNAT family N-acetyltransferase [Brevundimonas sp.]